MVNSRHVVRKQIQIVCKTISFMNYLHGIKLVAFESAI